MDRGKTEGAREEAWHHDISWHGGEIATPSADLHVRLSSFENLSFLKVRSASPAFLLLSGHLADLPDPTGWSGPGSHLSRRRPDLEPSIGI